MRLPAALEGVRVLDLCDEKGAYCGKLLAEMGAEVLLVEPPRGSAMRRIGPFHPGAHPPGESSLFFWHFNASKRSVAIDFESSAGRHQLLDLVKNSDVLLDSLQPGDLDAVGLNHAALVAANDALIHVSISPFGLTGPYRGYRISDLVGQAVGGLLYASGDAEGAPLQGFGLPAYHAAAIAAASAVVAALMVRPHSASSPHIDVSIHAAAAAMLEHAVSLYHESNTIPRRTGKLHWTRAFRPGRCGDGHVMHCTLGDWTALSEWVAAAVPESDLNSVPWQDGDYRIANHERLFAALDAWAAGEDAEALAAAAQMRRLAYAPVRSLGEVLRHPQLRARRYFTAVRHGPDVLWHPGPPFALGRSPAAARPRAPFLGEHNHLVAQAAPRPASGLREGTARACAQIRHQLGPPAIWRGTNPRSGGPSNCLADTPQPACHLPLEGTRVIDFTWAVAGPLATRILADYGAEVIKIEPPAVVADRGRRGLLSASLNRGKRSIVVDMNRPGALPLVRALIARSQVVADNFSPRVMPAWGLGDAAVRHIRPDVVSLHMSAFGQSGPFRDRVGYGPTLHAEGGHVAMMPGADGEPVGWGFSYSDMVAGRLGALAVLVALWHRQRSGQGQNIDLAQLESLLSVSGPALLAAQIGAVVPPGNASQEAEAVPHGVYRCADRPEDGPAADRWCAIAVFDDRDWKRFCAALGSPEWTRDPRFATHRDRLRNREAIDAHVAAWTASRTAEEVMHHLQSHGVAAGIVANARDLCWRDPQLRHRGFWVATALAGQSLELDGWPVADGFERPAIGRAPLPGEHTDEVLRSVLGLTTEEIAALRRDQVVA